MSNNGENTPWGTIISILILVSLVIGIIRYIALDF